MYHICVFVYFLAIITSGTTGLGIVSHIWGNTYPTIINKTLLVQKRLIRTVTGSPYRARTEPLFYANRILTVFELNVYMSGVFMYKCLKEPSTDIFQYYFQTNRDVHGRNTRNADALNVPFARLDIRKFNMGIHGAVIRNALPSFVCNSASLTLFKQRLRNYLIESKLSA